MISKKIIPLILGFVSFCLAITVTLGTHFINEVGWPLAWLKYEWRGPSYVEIIQYKQLWMDFFFWLVVILILLTLLKKLGRLKFSMKRTLLTVFVLVILAFDWAAIHDITKGEPDPYGEYVLIGLSAVYFGAMIVFLLRRQK